MGSHRSQAAVQPRSCQADLLASWLVGYACPGARGVGCAHLVSNALSTAWNMAWSWERGGKHSPTVFAACKGSLSPLERHQLCFVRVRSLPAHPSPQAKTPPVQQPTVRSVRVCMPLDLTKLPRYVGLLMHARAFSILAALNVASQRGHLQVVQELLKAGGQVLPQAPTANDMAFVVPGRCRCT